MLLKLRGLLKTKMMTGNKSQVDQTWIVLNKQGHLSGILDHSAFDTRESAQAWFQRYVADTETIIALSGGVNRTRAIQQLGTVFGRGRLLRGGPDDNNIFKYVSTHYYM